MRTVFCIDKIIVCIELKINQFLSFILFTQIRKHLKELNSLLRKLIFKKIFLY